MRDKLGSVVGDYLVGESVPADDVFPDELMYFLVGDVSVYFCFHPFSEVVCQDQNESLLSRVWHWAYYAIHHRMNGYGAVRVRSNSVGLWKVEACRWHLSHFWT